MFIETPRFPEDISLGVSGGPEFVTDLASNPGGFAFTNVSRIAPLHKYDAAHGVRTKAQFDVLKALFMNMRGRAHGFRFKDWADFKFDGSTGVLVKVSPGVYQLTNNYTYGSSTFARTIVKPVAGTVKPVRNGTPVTAGSSAGNFAVDTTTGLITFVADQSIAVSSITVGTTTTVHLASAWGSAVEITLTGFGGADAALLNGKTFVATTISGSDVTFALNTTGKTLTTGSAFARLLPVSGDVLIAASEFDVPVRFDTDFMQASMDYSKRLHTWGQIPLVEWRNPG